MVGAEGFEPPTLCSQSVSEVLLSFSMALDNYYKIRYLIDIASMLISIEIFRFLAKVPAISTAISEP
jgi:hypothetical protein